MLNSIPTLVLSVEQFGTMEIVEDFLLNKVLWNGVNKKDKSMTLIFFLSFSNYMNAFMKLSKRILIK